MSGLLTTIREDLATFLRSDEASGAKAFFSPDVKPIPIYTEKLGTIEDMITSALTRIGIAALVTTVVAKGARTNMSGKLNFENITTVVRIFEDPITNKTGVSASDCAEAIAWFTKKFRTAGESPAVLQGIALGNEPGRLSYDVIFNIDGESDAPPVRS